MTDDTIRRAMWGDEEAARECTEAGEALPCPICHSEDVEIKTSKAVRASGLTMMLCFGCGATVSFQGREDRSQTLAAWNTRAPLPEEPTGWVDCRERLPEDCRPVLLYAPNDELRIISGWYEKANEDFWTLAWRGGSTTIAVTHWMPLPQPPQEGDAHG